MARRTREPSAALFIALVAITFVGPMSVHLFLPAVALVRRAFAVDAGAAQLSFSLAMFAMAVGTLFYGSLSDRLGRLPVLFGGLALFTAGAAVAALASSLEVLIAGRVLQGLGAACGLVIARAVVRDVYGAGRLGSMIAYLTAAYVVGPMIAPPIGGMLGDAFGWRSIVVAPAVFGGVVALVAVLVIGETRHGTQAASVGLVQGYRRLLGSRRFVLPTLHAAFGAAAFFALNSGAAFLVIEALGRPASAYGFYFVLGAIGFMAGNFCSGRLSRRHDGGRLIAAGAYFAVAGILTMVPFYLLIGLHPITLFVPGCLMSFGQGLSLPHAQAAAIATDPPLTGTASGIIAFAMFLMGAVFSQLAAALYDGTAIPLMVLVIATMILSSACALLALHLPAPEAARR